jgi:hypothetical protein
VVLQEVEKRWLKGPAGGELARWQWSEPMSKAIITYDQDGNPLSEARLAELEVMLAEFHRGRASGSDAT